jgi:hypothetical protein
VERLTCGSCAFSCRTHPHRCGMVVFCFPRTDGKAHTSSLSPLSLSLVRVSSLSLLGMYLSFLSSLPRVRFEQQQATSVATAGPQSPSRLQQRPPLQRQQGSTQARPSTSLVTAHMRSSPPREPPRRSGGGVGPHARVQDIDEERMAQAAAHVLCTTRASVPVGEGSRLCTRHPLVLLFLY